MIKFKCPFCENEIAAQIDNTGPMPTGMLAMCDCPQARADWEQKHRAEIERRKQARAGMRSGSIIHAGRTPHPGTRRKR